MVNAKQDGENMLPELELGYSVTYEQMNTLFTFQKLWAQLSMWLRELMISSINNLGNKQAVVEELYSILTKLYSIFRIFYGAGISQKLMNLLSNFITAAWMLIEAIVNEDEESVNASTVELYKTADDISSFLAQINVYWNDKQWMYLFYSFINLFISEIIAMKSGNYAQEIQIYRKLDEVTDVMGSYMARGIIARHSSSAE